MKVYKCRQGHISSSQDCPYCEKIRISNDLFFGAINEED